jgi:siroheme decarboxylase
MSAFHQSALNVTVQGAEKTRGMGRAAPVGADADGHSLRPSALDDIDRALINRLQDGIAVVSRPFAAVAEDLGINEQEVCDRLAALLTSGALSRFGPMMDAKRLGGGLTLAALAAPDERFDEAAAIVNSFDEVAHNYARDHKLNMWFVLATEDDDAIEATCRAITEKTGLEVLNFPKLTEYALRLRFEA